MAERARVRLEPWAEGDLPLLRRLMGNPAMIEHLGGPESEEKLVERQGRYERIGGTGTGRMFKIVDEASGEPAGSVGNAICGKLGFELLEECDFEFPPGHPMRCNDWRLDLSGGA